MEIRKFAPEDAQAVSELIAVTMRTTNIKDYPAELLEQDIAYLTPERLIERSGWMHSYVLCDGEQIIGCGSIGPYWGKEDESNLFTIFVRPDFQGKGAGRQIMEALEQDEFFLRARRIEIPASITALGFYKKFGYDHKDGIAELDEEQHYKLEKFR
ncbi:MAG: GNAT family N-acetyltransferase [Ruminococcus sp.]|nr:GNAT family N-acetyltransferase [Ruminococcus sp.]